MEEEDFKEKYRRNVQIIALSIEEGVEIANLSRYTPELKGLRFLTARQILSNDAGIDLDNCGNPTWFGNSGWLQSYTGFDAYALRKSGEHVEIKPIGFLHEHPLLLNFLGEYNLLVRISDPLSSINKEKLRLVRKYLVRAVSDYFEKYPWKKSDKKFIKIKINKGGWFTPADTMRFAFEDEQQSFDEFVTRRCRRIPDFKGDSIVGEDVLDDWTLCAPVMLPGGCYTFELDAPGQSKVVLRYEGNSPLESCLIKSAKPQNLGNGVVVMAEERVPKYLKRVLGL